MVRTICITLMFSLSFAATHAKEVTELEPPGPHAPLSAEDHEDVPTFRQGQPIVATTFFYWYDIYTMAHFRDGDGTDALTRHPPESEMRDYSYRSTPWHLRQLTDMHEARVDVALPVYWGVPGQYDGWSFVGLKHLVEAHEQMMHRHADNPDAPRPPQIGLFYDTSTLTYYGPSHARRSEPKDLTTDEGRAFFFVTIRDFFSMIPPAKWARIDGKPIIFLYGANFAAKVDDQLFVDTRRRFRETFGVDCFLVKNHDWPGAADAVTVWGGATGIRIGEHVAALGPGYDHSAVPHRKPLVVERENGDYYRRQWKKLLRMNPDTRPWIVHVETWNEWHEGTDVARSQESGEKYMRLTAEFAERFHRGDRVPREGPYLNHEIVMWTPTRSVGLSLRPSGGDGHWRKRDVEGVEAVQSTAGPDNLSGRYLYFDVDDSFYYDARGGMAIVEVSVLGDGETESIQVEYDNIDPEAGPRFGAFRPTNTQPVPKNDTWNTMQFVLTRLRFVNRTNHADFRITPLGGERTVTIRSVTVRKLPGHSRTIGQTPEIP